MGSSSSCSFHPSPLLWAALPPRPPPLLLLSRPNNRRRCHARRVAERRREGEPTLPAHHCSPTDDTRRTVSLLRPAVFQREPCRPASLYRKSRPGLPN